MVVQATAVFIVDLLVSPAENYSQLQLNYQPIYQRFYTKHIAIQNFSSINIRHSPCNGLVSLSGSVRPE